MIQRFILIFAIIIGTAGGIGIYNYIDQATRGMQVLEAARPLKAGKEVESTDLVVVDVPKKFLAFARHAITGDNYSLTVGRKPAVDIEKGEIILYSHFDPIKNERALMQALAAEPGRRAISIPVSAVSSVSNTIEPGDFVDVIGTFQLHEGGAMPLPTPLPLAGLRAQDSQAINSMAMPAAPAGLSNQEKAVTRLLLQRAQVIGAGERFAETRYSIYSSERKAYNSVTLKVTPREAELLAFAMAYGGELTLALRHPSDTTTHETENFGWNEMLKYSTQVPAAVETPLTTATEAVRP